MTIYEDKSRQDEREKNLVKLTKSNECLPMYTNNIRFLVGMPAIYGHCDWNNALPDKQ